jgi:hypothetical protein
LSSSFLGLLETKLEVVGNEQGHRLRWTCCLSHQRLLKYFECFESIWMHREVRLLRKIHIYHLFALPHDVFGRTLESLGLLVLWFAWAWKFPFHVQVEQVE